jgi:hypothetical protein
MRDGDDDGQRSEADEESQQYRVGSFPTRKTMEPRSMDPDRDGGGPPGDGGADPPWYIDWIGQSGVYMGVVAVVLAAAGVTLSWQGIQPYGNMGITLSLVLAVVAMILGIVFQIYLSDFDAPAPW